MSAFVSETTRLTIRLGSGDGEAAKLLLPRVYDELRVLAESYLRNERPGHTLQPTALVHEVFLRLVDADQIEWHGRAQFLALAAEQIRRVLIDHARRRKAEKRGGERRKLPIQVAKEIAAPEEVDLLQLDEALKALAARSMRQAKVVELRFFGGLSVPEVSHVLEVSERTVKEDWRVASAWLRQSLEP
ncbi:MAG: sigma-70 family RNA polymerase sigma factor [Planctomycetes bacterium]|nr:sigma-70 family RNA polymerase sigma factor [Planctomycetota bacterium]MBI3833444.1 sigma-70 family RNA polymerase sigma factor [Planctomycetota bacterium]